jgi:DNA-binding CsgD family transcriptional regulator
VIARGAETDLPFLAWSMAELEYRAGNWELAQRYAEEGLEAGTLSGTPFGSACDFVLGMLAAARGDIDRAVALAEDILEVGRRSGFFAAMLFGAEIVGFARLSNGDPAGCIGALNPVLDLAMSVFDPGQVCFVPDAIEAQVMVGDLEAAEGILDRFQGAAERHGRRSPMAMAARCRGLIRAARGDLQGAIGEIERALDIHRTLQMPFELARTSLVMGEVQRRAKRKRDARAHLEQALGIFEGMGAALWARRTRAELDRVAPPAHGGGLTPTEERVARLVAEGRTNREVAAELFISRRTVEANLARVYRKMGVRSRAQLAGTFASRRDASR